MKIKKPRTINGTRFKFINKFSLPETSKMAVALQILTPYSFDSRICHGKSSTEQVGISASMAFVPTRKLSNKNSEEILANNTT